MRLLLRSSQAAAGFTFLMLASHCYRIVPSQGSLVRWLQYPFDAESYVLLIGVVFSFIGIWLFYLALCGVGVALIRPFEQKRAAIVVLAQRQWPFPVRKPVVQKKFHPVCHIRNKERRFG